MVLADKLLADAEAEVARDIQAGRRARDGAVRTDLPGGEADGKAAPREAVVTEEAAAEEECEGGEVVDTERRAMVEALLHEAEASHRSDSNTNPLLNLAPTPTPVP